MGQKTSLVILPVSCYLALLLFVLACCTEGRKEVAGWQAPAEAEDLESPLKNAALAEKEGEKLYHVYCWSCHGRNGFGDGAAGSAQGQKPANFHDPRVKNQPDGALFWKMSTGRGNMPPFREVLTEEQRWQLVSYIRVLSDKEAPPEPPKALRDGITVSHFLSIGPQAVRILQHPLSGHLYYTTFDGDVFRIANKDGGHPSSEKILTVRDHGITRLQGAVFRGNLLFLCGNVDAEDKKGTSGRMVRYAVDASGAAQMSVVFNTVSYGSNKTIYDHGWNALAISNDGNYIYVNSGARTDHGEVQDNGGLYPNARDNALTGRVFRFPADAQNLMLEDNDQKLRAAGFLYADGIRNAYDMAFDAQGNLFGVVNSSDYDAPEDMFWIREGHHYGFPWVMGGIENPQQYPDWKPDPNTNAFINRSSHSWEVKYFHNDPGFPKIPEGVKFSPGVQNLGPDANEYRGHSGKVLDGDQTGVAVSTFTPHCSPLGLFFDTKNNLGDSLQGGGFVIRYSLGATSSLMKPFTDEGGDLLHLKLIHDPATDNFFVRTTRIVEGFKEPSDALQIGNEVYVIEYGGKKGNIWKLTLPAASSSNTRYARK